MPGWDKISRVDLDQGGAGVATPGFAWAGHGNLLAVLHEVAGQHQLRLYEVDPAAGAILQKDVVTAYTFGGNAPLCCEWTPDGRYIAVARGTSLELHDPLNLSLIHRTIALQDAVTVVGVVFRGNLIYGIDREAAGANGYLKAWDWDGNRVMDPGGQLMQNGKFIGNLQRVEDLSEHGYLMAFSDTQDSLIRFFDPMQIFIDHQAGVPRSGQVASCVGGGGGEIPTVWLATCSDVGGPRATTGVVTVLNDNDEKVETAGLWADYRDVGATLRFEEDLSGKALAQQLDHAGQYPTTGENGPPAYTAYPDPDAAAYHFQVETDGIGFKTALNQDRFLLSKACPNSRHWRCEWWQKTTGAICGMHVWYKDSTDFCIIWRVGNNWWLGFCDNGAWSAPWVGTIDAAQFPSGSWEHCEVIRNGNLYSLYVNGVGIFSWHKSLVNGDLSEYVSAGPFHRNTTAARTRLPQMFVPVGAEL